MMIIVKLCYLFLAGKVDTVVLHRCHHHRQVKASIGLPNPQHYHNCQASAQSARARRACALRALGLLLVDGAPTVHNVHFVKYDVTVSFMAQVLDTVTYLVPQVLDTAS